MFRFLRRLSGIFRCFLFATVIVHSFLFLWSQADICRGSRNVLRWKNVSFATCPSEGKKELSRKQHARSVVTRAKKPIIYFCSPIKRHSRLEENCPTSVFLSYLILRRHSFQILYSKSFAENAFLASSHHRSFFICLWGWTVSRADKFLLCVNDSRDCSRPRGEHRDDVTSFLWSGQTESDFNSLNGLHAVDTADRGCVNLRARGRMRKQAYSIQ